MGSCQGLEPLHCSIQREPRATSPGHSWCPGHTSYSLGPSSFLFRGIRAVPMAPSWANGLGLHGSSCCVILGFSGEAHRCHQPHPTQSLQNTFWVGTEHRMWSVPRFRRMHVFLYPPPPPHRGEEVCASVVGVPLCL